MRNILACKNADEIRMFLSLAAVDREHARPGMRRANSLCMQEAAYAKIVGIQTFAKSFDLCIDALIPHVEPGLLLVLGDAEILPEVGGGHQYGFLDFLVAGTAADIAFDCFFYVFQTRIGILVQEALGTDDHARGAVAALHSPSLGKTMGVDRLLTLAQALDGGYCLTFKTGERNRTCLHLHPIDKYSTRAAGTFTAPILGTGKIKILTEESKELLVFSLELNGLSIYAECIHSVLSIVWQGWEQVLAA